MCTRKQENDPRENSHGTNGNKSFFLGNQTGPIFLGCVNFAGHEIFLVGMKNSLDCFLAFLI